MSIQDDPNRVVRTVDSTIAFIGHNQQANEDVLIECLVDSASNAVTWRSSSKARKGIDYVEANESLQGIIDAANNPPVPTHGQPVEGTPPPALHTDTRPLWQQLGFDSKAAWREAGSPQS